VTTGWGGESQALSWADGKGGESAGEGGTGTRNRASMWAEVGLAAPHLCLEMSPAAGSGLGTDNVY